MKLYVAGPMRGIPEFNFPAFLEAGDDLTRCGHDVYNPAAIDVANGFEYAGLTGHEDLHELGFDLRSALAGCMDFICRHADGIVMLPGWSDSNGAKAEVMTARALGLPGFMLSRGLLRWERQLVEVSLA